MRCRLGWIALLLFNSGLDSPLTFDIGRTLGLDSLLIFLYLQGFRAGKPVLIFLY